MYNTVNFSVENCSFFCYMNFISVKINTRNHDSKSLPTVGKIAPQTSINIQPCLLSLHSGEYMKVYSQHNWWSKTYRGLRNEDFIFPIYSRKYSRESGSLQRRLCQNSIGLDHEASKGLALIQGRKWRMSRTGAPISTTVKPFSGEAMNHGTRLAIQAYHS